MLQTIVRVCQIAFFALGALTLGWFLIGKLSGERQRPMYPYEQMLAVRAVDRYVEQLPRRDSMKRLLVLRIEDDYDDRMTEMLVDRIRERPEYDFIDGRPYADKGAAVPQDEKQAFELVDKVRTATKLDGVIYTKARRVTPRDGVGTIVELEGRLVPLASKEPSSLDPLKKLAAVFFPDKFGDRALQPGFGEVLPTVTERIDSKLSVDWFSATMTQTSSLLRFAIWLAVVGGLPFAFFPVVQAVTRREDNRLNAVLLTGLVAVDLVAAFTLIGLRPSLFGWALVLLAGFAGFVYDFAICDRIDEMRK